MSHDAVESWIQSDLQAHPPERSHGGPKRLFLGNFLLSWDEASKRTLVVADFGDGADSSLNCSPIYRRPEA